ncbi:MAG TPA: hypothetical protein VLG50_08055 [Candidatus Saccharimonadales bacterium]|nr:hypothetical protein [Candidatus Saccharimonadales bacterium]
MLYHDLYRKILLYCDINTIMSFYLTSKKDHFDKAFWLQKIIHDDLFTINNQICINEYRKINRCQEIVNKYIMQNKTLTINNNKIKSSLLPYHIKILCGIYNHSAYSYHDDYDITININTSDYYICYIKDRFNCHGLTTKATKLLLQYLIYFNLIK